MKQTPTISAVDFEIANAFLPFHIVLNEDKEMISIGKSLTKILGSNLEGTHFNKHLALVRPQTFPTIQDLTLNKTQLCVLKCLNSTIELKGQLQYFESRNQYIFAGNPVLRDLQEIKAVNLSLNDFALYDSLPDLLIAMQVQKASIEELKELSGKLSQHKKELIQSNEELQKFAYVASHDLQSPLRTITSFVQLLEKKYSGTFDKTAQDYFKFITDSTHRMSSLIHDLLSYSRLQKEALVFKELDLNDLMLVIKNNLLFDIKKSNAIINLPTLPLVIGDDQQLQQLFQNLISNAIKFRGQRQPIVDISFEEKDIEFEFCIKDNGIGISSEYLKKVFEIFQRLHSEADYKGTGIGLSICKRIANNHGGRIWVESNLGNGSSFYFTISKYL